MPGLIVPVAGRYVGAHGGLGLGILGDDGFGLSVSVHGQEINDTDAFGQTLLDGIYRGQTWKINYKCKEWARLPADGNAAGALVALHAFGTVTGNPYPAPQLSIIGRRFSDAANTLVLTSTAGTPAATSPATLTASLAVISPNMNSSFNMTTKVRELPMEFSLLPYAITSPIVGNVPFLTT